MDDKYSSDCPNEITSSYIKTLNGASRDFCVELIERRNTELKEMLQVMSALMLLISGSGLAWFFMNVDFLADLLSDDGIVAAALLYWLVGFSIIGLVFGTFCLKISARKLFVASFEMAAPALKTHLLIPCSKTGIDTLNARHQEVCLGQNAAE